MILYFILKFVIMKINFISHNFGINLGLSGDVFFKCVSKKILVKNI
jgi:hypothetical protein